MTARAGCSLAREGGVSATGRNAFALDETRACRRVPMARSLSELALHADRRAHRPDRRRRRPALDRRAAHRRDQTRKDGSRGWLRYDYGDHRDPQAATAWLWKFIDGAKTAGELYGRTL